MKCVHCGRKWHTTPDQMTALWSAAERFSQTMDDIGVPRVHLTPDNPLSYLDGEASCCSEPNIVWSDD